MKITGQAPAALVLAAGEGQRMGGPKALLLVQGRPLVLHHVERLMEAGCAVILVVARPSVAPLISELVERELSARSPAMIRVVAAETRAPSESLAVGLRALGELLPLEEAGLLITPVDLLPPRPETLRTLLAELDRGARAVTPTHRGQGGHPVAVRGELCAPYLRAGVDLDALPILRDVLEMAGAARVSVDVDDPAVLGDFDAPTDLDGSGSSRPRFYGEPG